jgi:hypothetical protein
MQYFIERKEEVYVGIELNMEFFIWFNKIALFN